MALLLVLASLAAPTVAGAAGTARHYRVAGRLTAHGTVVFRLPDLHALRVRRAEISQRGSRLRRISIRRVRAGARHGVLRVRLPKRQRHGTPARPAPKRTRNPILTIVTTTPAPSNAAAPSPPPAASASALVGPTAQPTVTAAQTPATAPAITDSPATKGTPDPTPAPLNNPPVLCDGYAATTGSDAAAGTSAAPYASAQKLLDALTPGQTGCLRNGRFSQYELRAHHGGTPAAPIVLTSAPGERATIVVDTDLYLPVGITDVTVKSLDITNNVASGITQAVMVQDFSDRSVWIGNTFNGNAHSHCMELGWAGHGTAHDTLIRRNRFRDCGDPTHRNQDHAIYVSQSLRATITENVFWNTAAYGIHLYPSADQTTVTHNVIVGSGQSGIIFASDQDPGTGRVSDDNTVAYNLIASSAHYGLDYFWGASGQGTGNVAHDNCLADNAWGAANGPMPGIALSANTSASAQFVDPAAHDFRLQPGSPCLAVVGYDTAALL